MLLVQSSKDWYKDWRTWKLQDEWRPSQLLHYWDQPEFWEESWRFEEICCHSKFSEILSANADVKISRSKNDNDGSLGTVTKVSVQGLEDEEIRGQVNTIQTTALLEKWKESWRHEETCCHSKFKEKPLLCFDLLTRPRMPFKVMHRKEVTHSDGIYERKSRGRKLADEMGGGKKNPIILS